MKEASYGLLAEFPSAAAVYKAAERMRDEGFSKWDVHSPFPIHGLDQAMGIKRSKLPYIVFCGGLTGLGTAFFMEYFTQVHLYPTIVQSKPATINTIPAFFPIMFELTILFSAFTTLFGVMALMGLPRWHHPLFGSDTFEKFSNDGFFISVESRDPKFEEEKTKALLTELGGSVEGVSND